MATQAKLDALLLLTEWYQTFDFPTFSVEGLANSPLKWAMLKEEAGTFRGQTVLDVGCNQGYYTFRAALEGGLCTGIDIDPKAIATASLLNELVFRDVRVDFRVAQVRDLSLQSPRDIVICFSLLHHVPLLQTIRDISAITLRSAYIEALVDLTIPNERPMFSLSNNTVVKEVLANPVAFEAVLRRNFRRVKILNPGSDRLMARCDK